MLVDYSPVFWLIFSTPAVGQNNKESFGCFHGTGGQWLGIVPYSKPYEYEVLMVHLSYGYAIGHWRNFRLDLVSEWQTGLTRFAEPSGPPWSRAFEIGAAFGLRQLFAIVYVHVKVVVEKGVCHSTR